MNRILLTLSAGLLLESLSLAQDTTPPTGATPPEQQSPAAAPNTQHKPTPSTPQPPSQQAPGRAGATEAAGGGRSNPEA